MKKRNWFSVDTEGLAQLQAGRPKWHTVRELVQNAFDEETTRVEVTIERLNNRTTQIRVEDDCPEGFKDLTDAFTLFGDTYKRTDPTKRGRFNLGEKQAIAQAQAATIETTKGTVIFDGTKRRTGRTKRQAGSAVTIILVCKVEEQNEMVKQAKRFVAPLGVSYLVNGEVVSAPAEYKTFAANALKTVQLVDGALAESYRSTEVKLYVPVGKAWLYELGIPVMEIDCKWSVDVQQKIPVAMDRDSVRENYLADIYAQVLNHTIDDIKPEESSESWARAGAGHFECKTDTTKAIIQRRFGDKVATYTPNDNRSNDEAIANGYKLVHASELSTCEWERVKQANAIQSSASLFGLTPGNAKPIKPTDDMLRVAGLAKRIAKRTLGIDIAVEFIDLPGSHGIAWYGSRTLKFVVPLLPESFFTDPTAPEVVDLIIHELGHEKGSHTERAYLDALTNIGGQLVSIALREPEFFQVEKG